MLLTWPPRSLLSPAARLIQLIPITVMPSSKCQGFPLNTLLSEGLCFYCSHCLEHSYPRHPEGSFTVSFHFLFKCMLINKALPDYLIWNSKPPALPTCHSKSHLPYLIFPQSTLCHLKKHVFFNCMSPVIASERESLWGQESLFICSWL